LDEDKEITQDSKPQPKEEAIEPIADKTDITNSVIEALKSCYDPEIPVNIYELGLIYGVYVDDEANVEIEMTLTSPACPVAGSLPPEVEAKVKAIPAVKGCKVKVVWDPPWDMSMMSEEARLQLNLY
jgi:FeS assembly SUF system protein